ncbi:hypothetical protein [Paenibacillus sp. MBLB4367]|uniref:hypothetical protein n=1 Tax=Paenibacillus sp. MBLB4367 TaxID=3384767 RepID=UPI003908236A
MMNELRNQIEAAYLQCHLEVSGLQVSDMDVRIVRNHIVIMRIDGDETGQSPMALPVYGEDGHPHALETDRDRLHGLLKQKLTDITGFEVTSIQSDIYLDTGEKLDLIHFESDVESKFICD